MASNLKVDIGAALNKGVRWIMRGAGNGGKTAPVKVLSVTPMVLNGQTVTAVKLSFPPKVETVTDRKLLLALLKRTEAVVAPGKRDVSIMTAADAKAIGISQADVDAISDAEADEAFGTVRGL